MTISNYYLVPPLPEELAGLADAALDLRWSWSHAGDRIWSHIDPSLWELTRNPWLILQTVSHARLRELARDERFRSMLDEYLTGRQKALQALGWFEREHAGKLHTVAYFSMEFGLTEALPIYSGGLGILAGDCLKTSSDLGVPMTGVGLLFQQGYFRQVINADGTQKEFYPYNDPGRLPIIPVRDAQGEWLRVKVEFPGRTVILRAWEAQVGRVMLYLLDSNDPENSPADRGLTAELYSGDSELRLQQEIAFGIGGWQLLRLLGKQADVVHLNEGHSAFAVLERARCFMEENRCSFKEALVTTRAGNVFTTHTPVVAGFDRFPSHLVVRYLDDYADRLGIGINALLGMGRADSGNPGEPLNMAYLAARGSGKVIGVSRLHGEVSRRIFQPLFPRRPEQEIPVGHITNGVHMPSWDSPAADELWTETCGKERWLGLGSEHEACVKRMSDEKIWKFRAVQRKRLVNYARTRVTRQNEFQAALQARMGSESVLDPDALTLGFARRFATYKRPTLLLHDPDRFMRLLTDKKRPVQLIIAGKAHPQDEPAKRLIRDWFNFLWRPEVRPHVVFLADYDMLVAEQLVQGVDVWINTPRRPMEASGTSGMKVLVNGGLNLSVLDGWWAEAYRSGTGWGFGASGWGDEEKGDAADAAELYRILEQEVVPEFYNRNSRGIPEAWVERIRRSMAEITPQFGTQRMVREYTEQLYIPASAGFRERSEGGAAEGKRIAAWLDRLESKWLTLYFGTVRVSESSEGHRFEAEVGCDGFDEDEIAVELFAEAKGAGEPVRVRMERVRALSGRPGVWLYAGDAPADRSAAEYTPRIVPYFPGVGVPLETGLIFWQK